jgi:hypothetical protein
VISLQDSWDVLALFLIPVGGGIPGGVLLADHRGISWEWMALLYFISDVILACVFEPLMLLMLAWAKRSPLLTRFGEAMKQSTRRTIALYGDRPGPFVLILVAFGVDPMTGRAAAVAAGHGFLTGWGIAIAGDMLYFGVVMACTLWLHDLLGDGTVATLIILLVMTVLPILIRKLRRVESKG